MSDRVIVEVDEDLSDLIPGFMTHKRADIDTIFEAVTRRDYAEIGAHRASHQGRRGQLRIRHDDRDRPLARHAAATRDDGAVTTLARQLLSYLDHVEIVFQPARD